MVHVAAGDTTGSTGNGRLSASDAVKQLYVCCLSKNTTFKKGAGEILSAQSITVYIKEINKTTIK